MHEGSIVSFREREGEDPYIAIVQREWSDGSLQLFVLHHQASANVRAARREQCEVIIGASQVKSLYASVSALNDKLNYLIEQLEARAGKEGAQPDAGEEDEDGELKPWPSSSSRSTSRGRRQPSNASVTS